MKTFYIWKKIDNKKVDLLKLRSTLSKEEVIEKLKKQKFDYDGIDIVRRIN